MDRCIRFFWNGRVRIDWSGWTTRGIVYCSLSMRVVEKTRATILVLGTITGWLCGVRIERCVGEANRRTRIVRWGAFDREGRCGIPQCAYERGGIIDPNSGRLLLPLPLARSEVRQVDRELASAFLTDPVRLLDHIVARELLRSESF